MIRLEDAKELEWAAWSLIHGLAMLVIDSQIPISEKEAVAFLSGLMARIMVEGLH